MKSQDVVSWSLPNLILTFVPPQKVLHCSKGKSLHNLLENPCVHCEYNLHTSVHHAHVLCALLLLRRLGMQKILLFTDLDKALGLRVHLSMIRFLFNKQMRSRQFPLDSL